MGHIKSRKTYTMQQTEEIETLSKAYRKFLDSSKTERECINEAIDMAEAAGYVSLETKAGSLKSGDKVYSQCMGKALALFHIGRRPIEEGIFILGAHTDSPRLDLKQQPLYEDQNLAFFDTHYYGGIKKYQWVTIPLAIHGVVAKKDGNIVEIRVGDEEGDPVFCVTDLLIHLASEQQEKRGSKIIEGENLDILIGSSPLEGTEKDAVKANVLSYLNSQYGITEEDFVSAELEAVPAGQARDVGFDRSMILGYGHDDRACAFASLQALLKLQSPSCTACCVLVDKEEIGSVGATGAQSRFFENAIAEILSRTQGYHELSLRRCLSHSRMLSSDVSAAYDPLYSSVFDSHNSAYLGYGVVFNKYTGSRGKSGSSDANAEYVALIRKIMDEANIAFQVAELGKVDAGGGGTIAYLFAKYGMDVIDCGVPVLSMHAPWEIVSKADLYEAYRCYLAFLEQV